jgi:hypothetical protein
MSENLPATEGDLELSPEVKALLEAAAQQQAEEENLTIPFISLKGKKFAIGDDKIGDTDDNGKVTNRLTVAILAGIFDNSYYDRAYNADVVTPPACFSLYHDIEDAVRDDLSPTPISDNCKDCALNQFESAAIGKGKACRNGRRILVATIYDGRVNLASLGIINISPTALRNFSKYVKAITVVKKLPLWAVSTTLSFDEDLAYPSLTTSFNGALHGLDIEVIAKRLPEFEQTVAVPYDVSGYEPPAALEPGKEKKASKMS